MQAVAVTSVIPFDLQVFRMLTQTQIAHYLIADGLASTQSIVDGDFEVVEATRRNCNFKS
jgi:hypothetical protein